MSLKISGNLNQLFGMSLPVPFIERVKVYDPVAGDPDDPAGIVIDLAMFFNVDEYSGTSENFDDFLNSDAMQNLNIGVALMFDKSLDTYERPIWMSRFPKGFDNWYTNITTGRRSVLTGLASNWTPATQHVLGFSRVAYVNYPTQAAQADEGYSNYNFLLVSVLDILGSETSAIQDIYSEGTHIKKWSFSLTYNTLIEQFQWVHSGPDDTWEYETEPVPTAANIVEYYEDTYGGADNITQAGFVSFSTVLSGHDSTDPDNSLKKAKIRIDPEDPWARAEDDPLNYINAAKVSDISYCTFLKDGGITSSEETIFVDIADNVVENVIQAIDGSYYAQDIITLVDIVTAMEQLVGNLVNNDEELLSAQQSILYLLAIYGTSPSLLVHLNNYRKTLPDTSNQTRVGRLNNRFQTKLYNANIAAQRGTNVQKRLVYNPRVSDYRGANTSNNPQYSQPGSRESTFAPGHYLTNPYSWSPDDAYIYPGSTVIARTSYMDPMEDNFVSPLEYYADELGVDNDLILFLDWGNYFFDYEKALKRFSTLAQFVDVNKIESYFGREFTQTYFYPYETMVHFCKKGGDVYKDTGDYYTDGQYQNLFTMVGKFMAATSNWAANNLADQGWLIPKTSYLSYFDTFSDAVSEGIVHMPAQTNLSSQMPAASYIAHRMFGTYDDDGMTVPEQDGNVYRLMCMEFVKAGFGFNADSRGTYIADADDNRHFYEFEMIMYDNTGAIIAALLDVFNQAIEQWQEYYAAATEPCAYNNIDGYFNDFFTENVFVIYGDNPSEAPYITVPLYLEIMKDLVYNAHNGEMDKILIAAKNAADKLSPQTGALEQVELFNSQLTDTYAVIAQILEQVPAEPAYLTFGAEDRTEMTSRYTVSDLPPYSGLAEAVDVFETEEQAAMAEEEEAEVYEDHWGTRTIGPFTAASALWANVAAAGMYGVAHSARPGGGSYLFPGAPLDESPFGLVKDIFGTDPESGYIHGSGMYWGGTPVSWNGNSALWKLPDSESFVLGTDAYEYTIGSLTIQGLLTVAEIDDLKNRMSINDLSALLVLQEVMLTWGEEDESLDILAACMVDADAGINGTSYDNELGRESATQEERSAIGDAWQTLSMLIPMKMLLEESGIYYNPGWD